MHKTILGLAGISASLFFVVSLASADNYKWCGETASGMGASNCGYVTREQCEATVRADGGFCRPNLFYTGAAPEERLDKASKSKTKRNPG